VVFLSFGNAADDVGDDDSDAVVRADDADADGEGEVEEEAAGVTLPNKAYANIGVATTVPAPAATPTRVANPVVPVLLPLLMVLIDDNRLSAERANRDNIDLI
jgi:hypothetical protein